MNHSHHTLNHLIETLQTFLATPATAPPSSLLAMFQNAVTEVQRLQQQVKHQQTLFESVVYLAPVVIVLLDDTEQVILANQKYQKLATDFPASEPPISLFLNTIKDQLGKKWETLRNQHSSFSDQEVRFDPGAHDHPRWFACSGHWFVEPSGHLEMGNGESHSHYFLLVAHDITLLKRQQEEIRMNALRAVLAEEELTDGIRETLAGAIHQLQGPTNLISAAIARLKHRAETKGTEDPLCSTLQETLEKSTQVLDHLRHCTPLLDSAEESVPVNLNKLLRDVLSLCTHRLLAEGIMVNWQPALVLPSVLGHIGRLRSMFKHLITNAIEAMSHNRGDRELRICTQHDGERVTVFIEDTGPGIPEPLRLKVFEPFFTTKQTARRTGMGLAAVQEIVNSHAGTIYIDPNYSTGCRFIVQFPTAHYRNI